MAPKCNHCFEEGPLALLTATIEQPALDRAKLPAMVIEPTSSHTIKAHVWRFTAGTLCVSAALYASVHSAALAVLLNISDDLVGDIRSFLLGTGATLLFLGAAGAGRAALNYFGNLTHVYPAWRSSVKCYVNEFHDDANVTDYSTNIRTSSSCTVVLNDGFTWVKRNWRHLVERVNEGLPITFVICHPDSKCLAYIAEKSNKGFDEQKKDVLQCVAAVRLLAEINHDTKVQIFGSRLVNCYAGFLFQEALYVSPYHTRFRQDHLPAIELRRAPRRDIVSAFGMFETDINEQIRNCKSGPDFDLLRYPDASQLPKVDLQVPGRQ